MVPPVNGTLRERKGGKHENNGTSSKRKTPKQDDDASGLSTLDIIRIVAGLLLLNCLLSYFITSDSFLWGYRPWFVRPMVVMQWIVSPPCKIDVHRTRH